MKFPVPNVATVARAFATAAAVEAAARPPVGCERPRLQGAETFQVLVLRVTNYHA